MAFRFKTSGIEATIKVFEKRALEVEQAADHGVEHFARRIFERSQYYVPVRDPSRPDGGKPGGRPKHIAGGSLKQSGQVFQDKPGTWVVGYGGDIGGEPRNPFYAVYVHEIPQPHVAPGRMKYLEFAVMELIPEMPRVMRDAFISQFYGTTKKGEKYAVIGGGEGPGRGTGYYVQADKPGTFKKILPKFGPTKELKFK